MPIFLETPLSLPLGNGDFIDLWTGAPKTGTQPIQSVVFNASAPNLLFTSIDPVANDYTLVHRAPVAYEIILTPNVGPG